MNSSLTANRAKDAKAIWVFTPSRTDPKDLEFILVQRQKLLQDAVERVRESAFTDHKHHLLFVGPRGCGKTHLVTLIVNRLSQDDELTNRLRIAWLNEDETCTTLLELLFKIHAALEKRYPAEYRREKLDAAYEMKQDAALDFVSRHLISSLGSRTLLVMTENLDAIFEGLGDAGQKQLRSFIQENPKLSIVATAQRLVEDLSNRNSPFFGFFQTEHLKPLNVEQATELLQNIARLQEKGGVVEFLATARGRSRVRAIHHLSGGNHRIYIVLSQFITRDSVDGLLEPFMKMVDELTPYYQERIRWLPPLQRKIVEYLCTCEGTVPVKEIAKRLFATPQTISSQLQDLREKGYVETNQRGRESLYEISEPLMRICVEVKDNQRLQPLRLLVDFLRVWYEDHELKSRLGLQEPSSAGCAYLEAAIQRNCEEGNLRMKLMLDDLGIVTSGSVPDEIFAKLTSALPEGLLVAAQCLKNGDKTGALDCFTESIQSETESAKLAQLLVGRGLLFNEEGQRENAIQDFCIVIDSPESPVEQLALAILSRGIIYGKSGDPTRAVDDYTAVIGLSGAPPELVAMSFVNRGFRYSQAGEQAHAIDDYTSAINLPGSPTEQVAIAHVNRGATFFQAGEQQRAIDDYTAVIAMPQAPVLQVARALLNRAVAHGQASDRQRAIDDHSALIALPDAPIQMVSMAYLNRGILHGEVGDQRRAIVDYTALIELPDAPVEQVAKAHYNRGVTYGQVGDQHREIADYTAVIELAGIPAEQVAMAYLSRGITFGQLGDPTRAIADYTAAIELPGVPAEHVTMALFSRGICFSQTGDSQRMTDDYTAVLNLPGVHPEHVAMALYVRGVLHFQENRKSESQADFEALIRLPEAPSNKLVDAHLALAELHFSEGRWSQGFQSLDSSLGCGGKAQPAYRPTAADLVGVVFSAGLNPEGRREKVAKLLRLYHKHQALAVLGEAVVQHLGTVFRAGEPFPSTDNLQGWSTAWEQAAENLPDFRLSARLIRTGIDYIKAGGKDLGILLALTSPERSILKQALGLAGEGVHNEPK